MQNQLYQRYGGLETNPLSDSCYFCYTIHDVERDMFYSGSRGVKGSIEPDIGTTYFTSSSVKDFKQRFAALPEQFRKYVEYFSTRQAAFEAETYYHKRFDVGNNPKFYNVTINGGTVCGAGSVLCISPDGTYRVSCQEYWKNRDKHVTPSRGKSNARNIKTGVIKKLPVDEITGDWVHELSGVVVAINKLTGKRTRISKNDFDANRDVYNGVTVDKAPMIDRSTGERRMVSKAEFAQNPKRFVGVSAGLTTATDISTGERITMTSKEYQSKKDKFKHHNSGMVSVYDIRARNMVCVSKEEFQNNKQFYSNGACPVYWEFNGELIATRQTLNERFKSLRGKCLPRVSVRELGTVDPLIKVIEK